MEEDGFESIPLTDKPKEKEEHKEVPPHVPSMEPWIEAYVNLMINSINAFENAIDPRSKTPVRWKAFSFRTPSGHSDRITVHRGALSGQHTKFSSVVNDIDAGRLYHVLTDFNSTTRCKWDAQNVSEICELETYLHTAIGKIVFARIVWRDLITRQTRTQDGIIWRSFDKATGTRQFVFRTTRNPHYPTTDADRPICSLTCISVIAQDDADDMVRKHAQVIVYERCEDLSDWETRVAWLKDWLSMAIRVTRKWNEYYYYEEQK